MKFSFNKEVRKGSYFVKISLTELSQSEKDKIIKFGAPSIDLSPEQYYDGRRHHHELPLSILDHNFAFDTEDEANDFLESMKNRIKDAVDNLNSLEDNFTKEEEHEF